MVTDHQCHWWPPSVLEWLDENDRYPRIRREGNGWTVESAYGTTVPIKRGLSDLDEHLAQADAAGVDVLVLSAAGLGDVMHLPLDKAVETVGRVNAAYAAAQGDHPDRIVALASLPMQDADAALEVLERAVALGLRGVCVMTSNDGRPVASVDTLPIYRRMAELGLPVVLHPAGSGDFANDSSFRTAAGVGWMCQTAAAAIALIDSGTLDDCPSLTVVHPHLGGVLPYIFERVDNIPGGSAELPIREYLRTRFYVDSVGPTPGALQLAIRTYGLDRVVFASDYPYISTADVKQWIADNASRQQAAAIYANRVPGLDLP